MGKIPPSIHGYCLSCRALASPYRRVPKFCAVSDRNLACRKITTIGFHADPGEYDHGHWLIGRGCLGGDRFGPFVSQIKSISEILFCSTERSYETLPADRLTLIRTQ